MGKIHKRSGKKNESVAGISRRDFIKYSGAAGGALLLGIHGGLAMSSQKSRVTFASTENRKAGIR
jgi:anaerobic selenocysteine-containing dehydrogenase